MKKLTTIIALACCLTSHAQNSLDSGLVACFPFSGNAKDLGGHALKTTTFGASLTSDRFGKGNCAYLFNGTDNVIQVDSMGKYLSQDEVAVSLWVRADALKQQCVFMLDPDNPNDRMMGIVNFNQGGDPYTIWDFGDITNMGRISVSQGTASGNWEHYVFQSSKSLSFSIIYKNGQVLSSANQSSALINLNRQFLIGGGSDYNGSKFFFKGAIDDIRIYNRTLDNNEITALFQKDTLCTETASIDNLNIKNNTTIFPNPSLDGYFQLLLSESILPKDISVYDFTGKLVYQNKNIIGNEIDLTKQAKGLYLLKISYNDNIINTHKLIIE
jgi:hypothetical protein